MFHLPWNIAYLNISQIEYITLPAPYCTAKVPRSNAMFSLFDAENTLSNVWWKRNIINETAKRSSIIDINDVIRSSWMGRRGGDKTEGLQKGMRASELAWRRWLELDMALECPWRGRGWLRERGVWTTIFQVFVIFPVKMVEFQNNKQAWAEMCQAQAS